MPLISSYIICYNIYLLNICCCIFTRKLKQELSGMIHFNNFNVFSNLHYLFWQNGTSKPFSTTKKNKKSIIHFIISLPLFCENFITYTNCAVVFVLWIFMCAMLCTTDSAPSYLVKSIDVDLFHQYLSISTSTLTMNGKSIPWNW